MGEYVDKIEQDYNCPAIARIENLKKIPPTRESLFVIANCNGKTEKDKKPVWCKKNNMPILPVRHPMSKNAFSEVGVFCQRKSRILGNR